MDHTLAMTAQYTADEKGGKIVNRLLVSYVSGLAHGAHVSGSYSELGDRLERDLADLEDRLAMQYALTETVPDRRLSTVLTDTEAVVDSVLTSDVVRIKVAYLDAVRVLGQAGGRHPRLLILDEPRQQDIDPDGLRRDVGLPLSE